MINREEISKLSALARITIPEGEIEKVRRDIDTILAYVGKIDEAGAKISRVENSDVHIVKNVMREDVGPHESGLFTEALLAAAPETENGYVKVKKILDYEN